MQRREAGFTFIEILVVMGIIVVLMGMVAVIVPRAQEAQRKTQSINNVRQMATIMSRAQHLTPLAALQREGVRPLPVADGVIDPSEDKNLEIFFSPGDAIYALQNDVDRALPRSHPAGPEGGKRLPRADVLRRPSERSERP